jgi:hypothetical protein
MHAKRHQFHDLLHPDMHSPSSGMFRDHFVRPSGVYTKFQ